MQDLREFNDLSPLLQTTLNVLLCELFWRRWNVLRSFLGRSKWQLRRYGAIHFHAIDRFIHNCVITSHPNTAVELPLEMPFGFLQVTLLRVLPRRI
jgi:hypothetical protein